MTFSLLFSPQECDVLVTILLQEEVLVTDEAVEGSASSTRNPLTSTVLWV